MTLVLKLNLTFIFYISLGIVLIGCSGKSVPPSQPPDQVDNPPEPYRPPDQVDNPSEPYQFPDWVDNPPFDDEFLYVVGSGTSRNLGLARRKATQNARAELALKIEATVTVLVENFEEEVGSDPESTKVSEIFSQLSKSVANQILIGSRNVKTYTQRRDNSNTVWVLMELPTQNIVAGAVATIRKDKVLYNRWRVSEAFKELEGEVNKKGSQSLNLP